MLSCPLEGQQPHGRLRDLNYIYFYPEKDTPGSGFGTGLTRLVEALSVDIAWLREHTRLEELAARWDANARVADLLLRGSELAGYKAWRDRHPANAPELTALQRAFLAGSEEEEANRANAERKQLDEMAAANAERAKALAEAHEALQREAHAQKARARARRIIQWGSAAASLALLAVAVLATWQSVRATRESHKAEDHLRLARRTSEDLVTLVTTDLRTVPGIKAKTTARILDSAKRSFDQLAPVLIEDLSFQKSRAEMMHRFGEAYSKATTLQKAEESYTESLQIYQRLAAANPMDIEPTAEMQSLLA